MNSPLVQYLSLAVRLAGLFHDLGKGTVGFATKLSDAVAGAVAKGGRVRDPLRHELVSVLLLDGGKEPLPQMTSPAGVREFFEARARWLESAETRAGINGMLKRCLNVHEKGRDELNDLDIQYFHDNLTLNRRDEWAKTPFWMSVMWLVLTHHKLPTGGWSARNGSFSMMLDRHVGATKADEDSQAYIDNYKRLGLFMTLAPGQQPWESPQWLSAVSRTCRALRLLREKHPDVEQSMFRIDESREFGRATPWLALLVRVGRASLVIGDYEASSDAIKPSHQGDTSGLVFANTKDTGSRYTFGDTLERHLRRVGHYSPRVLKGLLSIESGSVVAPVYMGEHEKPAGFALPEVIQDSPYAWQAHAQRAFEQYQDHDRGLFCVVAAGTGRGKTRGCAAMMASARRESRFSVMLSMRSLTYQTAAAYLGDRIGFRHDQVAMMVGDDVLKRRYKILQQEVAGQHRPSGTPGTEHGLDDPWNQLTPVMWEGKRRASTPLNCLADEFFLMKLLSAPVSVMTVDHVIRLIDLKASRDLLTMMHLMSTDIVLDEIDDYKGDDLICIGRLIELAGQFGRRVIIASATLPKTVAESYRNAYLRGYEVFQSLTGAGQADSMIVTHLGPYVSLHDSGSYGDFYDQVMQRFCEEERAVAFESPRRTVLNTEQTISKKVGTPLGAGSYYKNQIDRAREHYFSSIIWLIRAAHAKNNLTDPATRVQYSVGFVRLNTVKSVQAFTNWLVEHPVVDRLRDSGVGIKLLCYHAQNLGMIRVLQERFLEKHLNRTPMNSGEPDPFIAHQDVRHALDEAKALGHEQTIFLIVTSSIMETGRDFDFDWCILEPCSTQSIVQAGGRVRRHRTQSTTSPNVLLLPVSFDAMITPEYSWRDMKFTPYVPRETPRASHKAALDDLGICHQEVLQTMPCSSREAFARELNMAPLHAGHCLQTPACYKDAPLTAMERVKQLGLFYRSHALEGREPYTLQYSTQQGDALLCSAVYENTPFRGSDESAIVEFVRNYDCWFIMDEAGKVETADERVVVNFGSQSDNDLFLMRSLNLRSMPEVLELSTQTALEIGYSASDLELAESSLLSCSRRANFRSLIFHPQTGFSEPAQ